MLITLFTHKVSLYRSHSLLHLQKASNKQHQHFIFTHAEFLPETITYFHYRPDSFILLCRCFALSLLSATAKILTMQLLARYHISFYSFLHHGNTGSCLTFASMTTCSYNAVSNKCHYTTHSASRMNHKSPATFQ